MKNKRGLSPLIAWVLLIGFSVAAALLITSWAVNEFSNLEFPQDESYCENIQLELDSICISSDDTVRLNLSNEGYFSIKRLTVGRETTSYSEEWCTMLNIDITPNSNISKLFKAGSENSGYSNIRETECSELQGGVNFNSSHNLTKIEIVPWGEIDGESFHCIEKAIFLNNSLALNINCA